MKTFKEYRPTQFDQQGLGVTDNGDWLVAPCGTNRDADCLTRANWAAQLSTFKSVCGAESDYQVLRFGHWGPGWFEIVIVRPDSACAKEATDIESALADYPVLNDELFSEYEAGEANEVWSNCYSTAQRIAYMRKNRSQFEFHDFADILACARGKYFAGYASELIS